GQNGDLVAVSVQPSSVHTAWCARQNGLGSPMTTSPDGSTEFIVWSVGAEQDNRLHGFDGLTGAVVFDGGTAGDALGTVRRFWPRDRPTGEVVAVKKLHAHLRDGIAVERFHRESRLLARVSSPYVVRYVAHGHDESGAPCLVVEWLTGEDLGKRKKRAGLGGS